MFSDHGITPLEIESEDINNGREEVEEVNSEYEKIREKLGIGNMGDKEDIEDLKTFLKTNLENMTRHFMQGFELLASQLRGNSTLGSSNSTPHNEKKTYGEAIFSNIGPHKQPP